MYMQAPEAILDNGQTPSQTSLWDVSLFWSPRKAFN